MDKKGLTTEKAGKFTYYKPKNGSLPPSATAKGAGKKGKDGNIIPESAGGKKKPAKKKKTQGGTMDNSAMIEKAKQIVVDYFNNHKDKTDHVYITKDEVFIVWFCKTLQNWKALVSTTIPDGMYYEITHNGDKGETYLDAYKKWENVCIPD